MIIQSEIIITPDRPVVRFRESRDTINLDEELPKLLHRQGWGLGTFFNVQFLNREKTELLSSATFVVTHEKEQLHTSEANPYQPMTRTVFSRKAEQTTEWWISRSGKEAVEEPIEPVKSNKRTKTATG